MEVAEMSTGFFCSECQGVIEECLPWLDDCDAGKVVLQSETMRQKIVEAADVRAGRSQAAFVPDHVNHVQQRMSTFDVIIKGYDKAKFIKKNCGEEPSGLQVKGRMEYCPIEKVEKEIFYTVKGYERRVSTAVLQKHSQDCMPRQLFDTQGTVTFDAVKYKMDSEWLEGLQMGTAVYEKALAKAQASGAIPGAECSPPAATACAPAQLGRGAVEGSTPITQRRSSVFTKGGFTHSKPSVPVFVATPSISPRTLWHKGPVSSPGAPFTGSTEAPSTPKNRRSLLPESSCCQGAGKGAGKRPGGPLEPLHKHFKSSPSPGKMPAAPPFLALSQLGTFAASGGPSLLSAAPTRQDDDVISIASRNSGGQGTLAKEFPNVHKFERPLLKWTVPWALGTQDHANALSTTKRMESESATSNPTVSKKLKDRHADLTASSKMFLLVMQSSEIKTVYAHYDRLVPNCISVLPPFNFCHLAVRVTFEEMPPRAKEFKSDALARLDVWRTDAKVEPDGKNPRLWSTHFSDEDLQATIVPATLKLGFTGLLLPSLIKDGIRKKPTILSIAKYWIAKIVALPQGYTGYSEFLRECRAIVLLFGKTPFEDGATADDVEFLLATKGALLDAIRESLPFNEVLSTHNLTLASEAHAWPEIEKAITDVTQLAIDGFDAASAAETLEACVNKLPDWNKQCRPGALAVTLQPTLTKLLDKWVVDMLMRQRGGVNVDADAVFLLTHVKKIYQEFKDQRIAVIMEQLTVFAKRHGESQQVQLLVAKCEALIADAIVPTASSLADALPAKGADVVIHVSEQKEVRSVWEGYDKLVWLTANQSVLSTFCQLASIADRFVGNVELEVSSSDIGLREQLKATSARASMLIEHAAYVEAVNAFAALGTDNDARIAADVSLTTIKTLMGAAEKLTEFDLAKEGVASEGLMLALQDIQRVGTEFTEVYSDKYCSVVWPNVVQEHERLKLKATGTDTINQDWDAAISAKATHQAFYDKAELTLGKVDLAELVAVTKAAHLALHFVVIILCVFEVMCCT